VTLYSRAFERATRRLVKSELAGSKPLRRQYRRHRWSRWNQRGDLVWPILLGGCAPALILMKLTKVSGWELLSVGLTGIVLLLGASLRSRLEDAHQHWPVIFLPMPVSDYIRFLLRQFARQMAFWWLTLISLHVYLGATHLTCNEALLGALGQGCVLTLGSVVSAGTLTTGRLRLAGWLALLAAIVLFTYETNVRRLSLEWLLTVTPAGWVILLLRQQWLPLIGLAALAATVPWAVRRLRALSETEPESLAEWRLSTTALEEDEIEPSKPLVAPSELRDVEARMERREFLEPSPPGGDVLERMVARFLNEREKFVAEFLLGGTTGWWTRHWRRAAIITLVSAVPAVLLPWDRAWWLALVGAVVAMFHAGPVLGGYWPLLRWHGWVPVGYWEMLRVLVKTNTVRVAAWLPLLAASGAAISTRLNSGPIIGMVIGCKVALLCWWSQPVVFAIQVSSETSDTSQVRPIGVLAGFVFFVLLLVLLGAAVMTFAPGPVFLVGAVAGAAAAWAMAALYGCGYNRVAFDARRR